MQNNIYIEVIKSHKHEHYKYEDGEAMTEKCPNCKNSSNSAIIENDHGFYQCQIYGWKGTA